MKLIFQTALQFLIVLLFSTSCKNEPLRPEDISNIPSNIIVKEKDSNGVYQLMYAIKLFPDNSTLYFDSIHITSPLGEEPSVVFDHSKYNSKKYLSVKYGDGNYTEHGLEVIHFKNGIIKEYNVTYDIINDIKIDAFDGLFDLLSTGYFLSYHQPIYSSSTGYSIRNEYLTDSLNTTNIYSFLAANQMLEDSFYTATFYDIPNKTNLLYLSGVGDKYVYSFFNITSYLPTFQYGHYAQGLFCINKIPFPGLNMNLVKTVTYKSPFYFKGVTENYSYLFDAIGRVIKVNILFENLPVDFFNSGKIEQEIELNYF